MNTQEAMVCKRIGNTRWKMRTSASVILNILYSSLYNLVVTTKVTPSRTAQLFSRYVSSPWHARILAFSVIGARDDYIVVLLRTIRPYVDEGQSITFESDHSQERSPSVESYESHQKCMNVNYSCHTS